MLLNRRYRKPDPLLVLAVLVGLGVLATTTARADPAFSRPAVRGAGYHTIVPSFARGAYRELVQDGVMNVAELGAKGPKVGLALRPPRSLRRALAAGGDRGTGRVDNRGTTIYVTFGTRW